MRFSYGKQTIDSEDIRSVIKVLKSDWLTQGPSTKEFEKKLNQYFGGKYCSVVSNGTNALFLAGLSLNWQKNDIVITSPLTFLASVNAIVYNNATPDFVDINSKDFLIDINKLEDKIKKYKKQNKKIKAVIGVDFAGQPCDWKSLRYLANKHNFYLINDNCHALGAMYYKSKKYAPKYADIVTQSFHPVKNITTGEGGSIITNNKIIDDRIKILRTHGMIKDKKLLLNNHGPWYYEMQELGYNFRISDIQCALGISQLKKLDFFVKKRNYVADKYNKLFKNDDRLILPKVNKNVYHAYHLYSLQIKFDSTKINKQKYFNWINC